MSTNQQINKSTNKKVYTYQRKQIPISLALHKQLKFEATELGISLKTLVEQKLTGTKTPKKRKTTKAVTTTKITKPSLGLEGTSEIDDLLAYAKGLGFPYQGTIKSNRLSAYNLLRKHGLENAKRLVTAAVNARGKPYSPTVNDFTQLYRKVADLGSFYQRNQKKEVKSV